MNLFIYPIWFYRMKHFILSRKTFFFSITRASQKFCKILIHATFRCVYHVNLEVQAMEGICCGGW